MVPVISITIMLLGWTPLSQINHMVISWNIKILITLVSIFNRITKRKIQLMIWQRETPQYILSYFVVGGIPRVFIPHLTIFSLSCLMIWDVERLLTTGSSRFQMRFMGVSLQTLMIYKHNLIRWIYLSIIFCPQNSDHAQQNIEADSCWFCSDI